VREPFVILGVIALLTITPGAKHILLGLVWLSTYAWLLDRTLEAVRGSRVRRALDALTGAVLVALGIRVAAD
jgi:threonine/homoserine/homoserine lactone efflux protein